MWWSAIFGADLVEALASHHQEAIAWHWECCEALRRGERPPYDTFIAAWSRGHMKSTLARRIAVADACLNGGGYCLYVSGTKDKVRGHALSIESLITLPSVKKFYPALATVKKGEQGQSKGWQRNFIYTSIGYVFHFVSLQEGVAGANVDNVRPTLIIPDDIDDRKNSPAVAEQRYQVFTREVIPTKQETTLFFLAQNVINRWSIMYRIMRQKVRVLTNRKPTKVVPAIRDLKTETRTIDGIVKDVIVSGEPTWPAYGLARAQQDIDAMTLEAFLAECQHEVDQAKSGLVLSHWDERVHVITWSQFSKVYRTQSIPRHWTRYVGHDWGNVHPNVTSIIGISPENSRLPGLHFLYLGLTAKQNALVDDVALALIERLWPDIDLAPIRNLDPEVLASWSRDSITDILNAPREIAASSIKKSVQAHLRRENWRSWCASHEQASNRHIYARSYGLPYSACNPRADGGVKELQRRLKVDYSQDHPFKPGEKGLAGFYCIVDDDQYYRIEDNDLVSEARDDQGLKLWREQFPEWVWRDLALTDLGLQPEKPVKVNDDAGNSLMMIYVHNPRPQPLTTEEKVEAAIPEKLRVDNLREASPNGVGLTAEQELAHVLARARAKKQVRRR